MTILAINKVGGSLEKKSYIKPSAPCLDRYYSWLLFTALKVFSWSAFRTSYLFGPSSGFFSIEPRPAQNCLPTRLTLPLAWPCLLVYKMKFFCRMDPFGLYWERPYKGQLRGPTWAIKQFCSPSEPRPSHGKKSFPTPPPSTGGHETITYAIEHAQNFY